MTSFIEYVDQFPDDAAYDIAKRVILDEPEMAIPLIADRVENVRRQRVHELEQGSIRRLLQNKTPTLLPDRDARATGESIRAFLAGRIALDAVGTYTTWGQASVAELQARRNLLLGKLKGLRESVKTIDVAIARIQAAGVRCLNDIADDLDSLEGAA